MGSRIAGWTLAFLAGAVWGVAFFSWGLPIPIPARVVVTLLLVLAMSVASTAGRPAAGAFTLGMGISSAVVVIGSGALLEWWTAVPVVALVASVALHAASLRGSRGPWIGHSAPERALWRRSTSAWGHWAPHDTWEAPSGAMWTDPRNNRRLPRPPASIDRSARRRGRSRQ